MILLRKVQLALTYCHVKRGFFALIFFLLIGLILAACRDDPADNSAGAEETPIVSEDGVPVGADAAAATSQASMDEKAKGETGSAAKEGDPEIEAQGEGASSANEPVFTGKEIVLCLGSSPTSLFPFGDESQSAEALRHALYEPLYSNVGYEYQAQGLEKLPSLADGDAVVQVVGVNEGDRVVDSLGNIVSLRKDVSVINSSGDAVIFDGTPLEMEQLVVDFTLRPMIWSDGRPVTAEDSVTSFELASNGKEQYRNSALAYTAKYESTGVRAVRWTGLPGYRDQTFFTNVWLPLPSHQESMLISADLTEEGTADEMRLSSGPFVFSEKREDGSLVLMRNPYYYRGDRGLPNLDRIIVRFGNGEEFLAGEQDEPCDVITSDALSAGNLALLETAAETGDWDIQTVPGTVFEHIAFGINPESEYAEGRPDWFEDARVRQAMTMCTDRRRMVDELTQGHGQIIHTYVSPDHPLYPDDVDEWPYDPELANALLDEAGYLDFADDGRRQDVRSGVPMTITLGTNSESLVRLRITEIMQENMADCGIPVETYDLTAGTWYAPGPLGRLFGRRFDLASFAWLASVLPDCALYMSSNIPGPEEFGFGGWQDINVTGWSNEAFDQACGMALQALPGGDGYEASQQDALRIFAQELPAIPLFTNFKTAAVRPWVLNSRLDSSQNSILWNIYEWDIEE